MVPSRKKKLGRRGGGREILCPMWRTYVHQARWGAGARSARAPRSGAERPSAAERRAERRAVRYCSGAERRRAAQALSAVTARKARRASQVEPVNCLSSNRSSSRASARPAPSPSALYAQRRAGRGRRAHDGTAHRAPSFRLEPNTHIPAAAGVADEVHGSPAAVLCRSICWVLALGPPWRGKKSEEDLRALFSYLTQGRRFAYLESSRSSPWHSTMGWQNR